MGAALVGVGFSSRRGRRAQSEAAAGTRDGARRKGGSHDIRYTSGPGVRPPMTDASSLASSSGQDDAVSIAAGRSRRPRRPRGGHALHLVKPRTQGAATAVVAAAIAAAAVAVCRPRALHLHGRAPAAGPAAAAASTHERLGKDAAGGEVRGGAAAAQGQGEDAQWVGGVGWRGRIARPGAAA